MCGGRNNKQVTLMYVTFSVMKHQQCQILITTIPLHISSMHCSKFCVQVVNPSVKYD